MRSKMWVRAASTAVGAGGLVLGTLVMGPAATAATSGKQGGPFETRELCDLFQYRAWSTGGKYKYVGDCYAYRPQNAFQLVLQHHDVLTTRSA